MNKELGATLMVDEAHATGVIGPTGRGLEEQYRLAGSIDVLMGTSSKAPGTTGGYVRGSRELVYYLRFYAHSAMFTAALPAALCAGVTQAFRILEEEPQHRERLWRNVRELVPAPRQVAYSAVPRGEAVLRLTVNARHAFEDLEQAVERFTRVGRRYGILGIEREEVRAVGERLSLGGGERPCPER